MRQERGDGAFYLWWLVVHWDYSDVKADPRDCFTQMIGYRENKLDRFRVRTNVHDWRHVGYFLEVHCMLKTEQKKNIF